ncbi:MAG: hypothetical protein K8W52_46160 [Deltaproteobacteria bacterium]|nr:hypothetical protein [Deltaproteobacteria bacterium]
MLPRYFVPSARAPEGEEREDRPDELDDVIASLSVRGNHGVSDVIVGLDVARRIHVVPATARRELSAKAQAQLAFDELTRRRRIVIDADELFLLDVQLVEQPPDVPGIDDPLYLYGTLRGPFPAGLAAGARAFDGQLMTSRGALLDGLRAGVERAFVYTQGGGGARFVHAAVPAEPPEVIASGRGVVLAFPVPPRITLDDDVANEAIVLQLFYDLLRALRTELKDDEPLPVPSRAVFEKELAGEGWVVEGDRATRPEGRGLLRSLFTTAPSMTLPREATLEEYRALAGLTTARIPGWPSPEVAALAARTRHMIGLAPGVAPPGPSGHAIAPPPVADAPVRAPRPVIATPRAEWIQDFLEQRRPTKPAPTKPAPTKPAPTKPASAPTQARPAQPAVTSPAAPPPSWMGDFDDPPARSVQPATPADAPRSDATEKPGNDDWRKDFD